MSLVYKCEHRVIYAECTVGNHIYHSRYLDILEKARGEFCRAIGVTLLELQNADFIFPVVHAEIRYLAPARYDETLTIELWVSQLTRLRLSFSFRILRGETRIVEGVTHHVCTTSDEKPRRAPAELINKLQPYYRLEPATI